MGNSSAEPSPKSSRTGEPSRRTRTFCGFRSRCTTPASCAAWTARQSTTTRRTFSSRARARRSLRERRAVDEVHHEVRRLVLDAGVVHADDVRVREAREDLRFAAESLEQPSARRWERAGAASSRNGRRRARPRRRLPCRPGRGRGSRGSAPMVAGCVDAPSSGGRRSEASSAARIADSTLVAPRGVRAPRRPRASRPGSRSRRSRNSAARSSDDTSLTRGPLQLTPSRASARL